MESHTWRQNEATKVIRRRPIPRGKTVLKKRLFGSSPSKHCLMFDSQSSLLWHSFSIWLWLSFFAMSLFWKQSSVEAALVGVNSSFSSRRKGRKHRPIMWQTHVVIPDARRKCVLYVKLLDQTQHGAIQDVQIAVM